MFFVVLCSDSPKGSPAVVLVLKRLRRWGCSLILSNRLGEAGKRTCDHLFTRHGFILHQSSWTTNELETGYVSSLSVK